MRTKTVWWCTLIKVNRHLNRQFRSEHTRWQFAITCRGDTCVLEDFCENLCRRNMSQKIKSDRICATKSSVHTKPLVHAMRRRNLLLQLLARPAHKEWSVSATCCRNSSPSVFRPLCLIRACLHRGGGPQVGEVTRLGGVTRQSIQSLVLMWSRLHVRWGNPPHVTSLTWGTPPSCKQAFTDQGSWNFLFLVCKHVSGRPYCWQYYKQFFEEFTWKQFFIPRCPPWRHVQTSNTILKVKWNHCFTRRQKLFVR